MANVSKEQVVEFVSSMTVLELSEFVKELENYDIEVNKGVSYFQGRKIKVVPNWFNI